MIRIRDKTISIMVVYCIVLHLWWAVCVSLSIETANTTAIDALYRIFDDKDLLVWVLVIASCCSIMGMLVSPQWGSLLLIPQQAMLLLSAAGVLGAVWLSQYADGVVRPRVFIAADQFYIVFAAILHTVALILHVRSRNGHGHD